MAIDYKLNGSLRSADVAEVFRSAGMKRPVDDLDRIQRMIDNADMTITAWDGDRMVGVARAVTDFAYCCYLSDLAVCKAYQSSGIGTELVQRVREQLGEEVALLLLSAPGAMDYYPKIGFNKAENAFLIPRVR